MRTHLKRLNFGQYIKGVVGLTLEDYVRNSLNLLERWSYEVNEVISDLGTTRTELTIASGVITVDRGYHSVDTQSDGASDDLDTINGGKDGMMLVLRAENSARTVVVKDGTGNIKGPGDVTLDNQEDTCTLIYDDALSAWLVVASSNNGA